MLLPKIATSSVLWLPFTVGVYWIASELYQLIGKSPLLNPTLLTIVALCAALIGLEVPYAAYFDSVNVLHYLLGTAVVALAIPLHRNLRRLARDLPLIVVALVAGSLTSILCGLMLAKALGVSPAMLLSIAPKSATAAVSMEIARGIGGLPAVTACLTIFTGIIGAVLGPYILTWAGVESPTARGVALGTASHGIATARAFSECELAGCCASLAMSLNAILTALLVPAVVSAMRSVGL
jgi:predicted murein hydrolase (TIGR00659 family)